jgi:hypothetical protein
MSDVETVPTIRLLQGDTDETEGFMNAFRNMEIIECVGQRVEYCRHAIYGDLTRAFVILQPVETGEFFDSKPNLNPTDTEFK